MFNPAELVHKGFQGRDLLGGKPVAVAAGGRSKLIILPLFSALIRHQESPNVAFDTESRRRPALQAGGSVRISYDRPSVAAPVVALLAGKLRKSRAA